MTEKIKVLVLGKGANYLAALKKLRDYRDLADITALYQVPDNENLFESFETIPPLTEKDIVSNVFDCYFITPGTPLDIKADLLEEGITEAKIFTELESLLWHLKIPEQKNIGSMKYGEVGIAVENFFLQKESFNDLEKYFWTNNKKDIFRWAHYFEVYERHFAKFRNTDVTVVEIGVCKGGSLKMWKNYFGSNAQIVGIDISPYCKNFEEDRIKIMVGSQEDRSFLKSVAQNLSKIDIVIDDGGHTMNQQIVSFEELFPLISENGVYLCEDLHTSYIAEGYGGRYRKSGTFVEYSKDFIDYINSWHFQELNNDLPAENFKHSAHSLHYYDSILVIEKRRMYPSFGV
ncbi:MAG: class I SAM-dependent methyltransferase [Sporomusaceae bacterium]|nr:class I SAM-dependent methyltransferase [Sporomusaceae bacterium]